jgi:glycosyltransferase involved in cell wall biosynthesis
MPRLSPISFPAHPPIQGTDSPAPDLICLSHLRWNFVFQRPQHLMTRCAQQRRVFYFEEPVFENRVGSVSEMSTSSGVRVAVPHLPAASGETDRIAMQRALLDELMARERVTEYVLWYYTPMALEFSRHLTPSAIVYDCMDELSAFAHAPAALRDREAELLSIASVVFTGGQSLYEAKRHHHHNVHACPSSVDMQHFARARNLTDDPADQSIIPHPRLGFFGVIDERMDIALLDATAGARPDWHFVMLGPVVKIDPAKLPSRPNIHYLGAKSYDDLPRYLAGWDVALLPFARNEATRFISPTKTPEYLAAGKPVVSTPIRDVVRPYGEQGLVRIAETPDEFAAACDAAMKEDAARRTRQADAFLRQTSWDGTWSRMRHLLESVLRVSDGNAARTTASAV